MTKGLLRFIITSLVVLAILYCLAQSLDTFGAFMLAVPFFIYFVAKGILSLVKAARKLEVRTNLKIAAGCFFALIAGLYIVGVVSDHGLRELTEKRKELFQEIRPVLLKYRERHGYFPRSLQDLVPDYTEKIPSGLLGNRKEDTYTSIDYYTSNGEAYFQFHRIRGPDSTARYLVSEDRYIYDQ